MLNWYSIEAEQRHHELLREAEQIRLAHLAESGGRRPARLRGQALIWIGNRLVASGRRLQVG
jgi:hypothetical protein